MRIPYVIDNIDTRLADVLNDLLQRQRGQQVDVATAYFSIRGFEQLRHTLSEVRRFRLLLGDQRRKLRILAYARMPPPICGMNSTPSHSPKPPSGWSKS